MEEIINEEYASSIGFEYFDVHDTWFVMAGSGSPTIKGEIKNGTASDVRVYFDTIPVGLNALSPDRAIAYAHKIMTAAYFARSMEGLPVDMEVQHNEDTE